MQQLPEENLTGQSDLLELFPFMQSFPFGDYIIQLEKADMDNSGIDPIIIRAAGGIVKPEFVNFFHFNKYTKIAISFYTFDIQFIYESADRIKKMDSIREEIDNALHSNDINVKLNTIRNGEKFIKQIGSSLAVGSSFNKILDEFLAVDNLKIDANTIKKIKSKSPSLDISNLNDDVKSVILSFYDIQLHHIKILLGVVIAAKIH